MSDSGNNNYGLGAVRLILLVKRAARQEMGIVPEAPAGQEGYQVTTEAVVVITSIPERSFLL